MGPEGDLKEVIEGLIRDIDRGGDEQFADAVREEWVSLGPCSTWLECLGKELLAPCRLGEMSLSFRVAQRAVLERPAADAPLVAADQKALLDSWRCPTEEKHCYVPPSVALAIVVCTWVPLKGDRSTAEGGAVLDSNVRILVACLAQHLESCSMPESFSVLVELLCDSQLPSKVISHLQRLLAHLLDSGSDLAKSWAAKILTKTFGTASLHQSCSLVPKELVCVEAVFSQLLRGGVSPLECAEQFKRALHEEATDRGDGHLLRAIHVRLALTEVERPDCARALLLQLIALKAIPLDSCLVEGLDEDLRALLVCSHRLRCDITVEIYKRSRLAPMMVTFGGEGQEQVGVGIIGITESQLKASLEDSARLCLEEGDWSKLEELLHDATQLSLSECGQELIAAWEVRERSFIETQLDPLLALSGNLTGSKQRWIARHVLRDLLPFSSGQLSWELFTVISAILLSQALAASTAIAAEAAEGMQEPFFERDLREAEVRQCYGSMALTWIALLEAIVAIPAGDITAFVVATKLYAIPSLWMIRGTFSHSLRLLCSRLVSKVQSSSSAPESFVSNALAQLVDALLLTAPVEVLVSEMDLLTAAPFSVPVGEGSARLQCVYEELKAVAQCK